MEFRPCIDIHNGKVKQIVGNSLRDQGDFAKENFVSKQDAAFYGKLYKSCGIQGGHIILLNSKESDYYEASEKEALKALQAYPKGLQIGGGITDENCTFFIEKGASKVIVTSYVFKDGHINYENLEKITNKVGKENLVLDLSARLKNGNYYIVTDRWQKYTNEKISSKLLDNLSQYCSEFLVHAVDVEGKANGIEENLVSILGQWGKIPITYAGGVKNFDDLKRIFELGNNKINVTIGSALDLFGGSMEFSKVIEFCSSY